MLLEAENSPFNTIANTSNGDSLLFSKRKKKGGWGKYVVISQPPPHRQGYTIVWYKTGPTVLVINVQGIQRCQNECPARQIASTEDNLQIFSDGKNFVIHHIYQCFYLYYTHNTHLFQEFGFLQDLLIQRCHLPPMLLGSSKSFWSLLSGKLRLLKQTVRAACGTSHQYFWLLQ